MAVIMEEVTANLEPIRNLSVLHAIPALGKQSWWFAGLSTPEWPFRRPI